MLKVLFEVFASCWATVTSSLGKRLMSHKSRIILLQYIIYALEITRAARRNFGAVPRNLPIVQNIIWINMNRLCACKSIAVDTHGKNVKPQIGNTICMACGIVFHAAWLVSLYNCWRNVCMMATVSTCYCAALDRVYWFNCPNSKQKKTNGKCCWLHFVMPTHKRDLRCTPGQPSIATVDILQHPKATFLKYQTVKHRYR